MEVEDDAVKEINVWREDMRLARSYAPNYLM